MVVKLADAAMAMAIIKAYGDSCILLALNVSAGASVALELPADIGSDQVSIPPETVVYTGLDPPAIDENFFIINGKSFIEKIIVTNLLGRNDDRSGALELVEIKLIYQVGEGRDQYRVDAGPYRLAPKGALGSEKKVTFLKPSSGKRVILISGIAFYEGGSRQTISSRAFSDPFIKITEDMLPPFK